MTTRIAAAITLDRKPRRPRRLRACALVLGVMGVHAAVLTSLESPREPSGRGQAVVSSALTVRQVAVPGVQVQVAARGETVLVFGVAPSPGDAVSGVVDVDARVLLSPPMPVALLDMKAKPAPAPPADVMNSKPAPPSRNVPRRTPDERQPAAATAAEAARARAQPAMPKAASPEAQAQPPRARSEAAARAADAIDGDPGASAAEALLPEHLLRSLPTYAVRLPPSQRLHFRVSRGTARGEGTLDWSLHDDGRYNAALRLRGEGMPGLDWTSEGDAAGDAGVLPRRMVAHRKGRVIAAANFAPDEQKVSFSGARVERPFVRGGQDRLTWMLQLAGVLEAREQPMRDDERIVLYVVGPRGAADLWQWRVAGRETLGEGSGAVAAVKLVREAQRLYDTEIELWLDPARHHLPLKWRQQQRGVERSALEWERVPG
jgi:hypothetical protein